MNKYDGIQNKLSKMVLQTPPELVRLIRHDPLFYRIKEFDFIDKIVYWTQPGLDTSYFAMRLIDHIDPSAITNRDRLLSYMLKSLWTERGGVGGFRQNDSVKFASIHAVHAAIGLIAIYFSPHRWDNGSLKCTEPAGRAVFNQYFGKDKVDALIKFIEKSYHHAIGGYAQNPSFKKLDENGDRGFVAINTTASAIWCLWHLEALDSFKEKKDKITGFLRENKIMAGNSIKYRNSKLDYNNGWICSTYYAHRIAMTLHRNKIIDDNDPLITELKSDRDMTRNFLFESMDRRRGGFGAAPNEHANMIHTKDALSLLESKKYITSNSDAHSDRISDQQANLLMESTRKFLNTACHDGLCGLGEHKYFLPNIYATYLSLRVKKMIDNNYTLDAHEKETIMAFVESCFDYKAGAYSGFSTDERFVSKDYFAKSA